MLLIQKREYDIPLRHCTIKIDENLYPAEMQEHRLISEGLNANIEKKLQIVESFENIFLRSQSPYSNQNLLKLNVTMDIVAYVTWVIIGYQ